MKEYQVSYRGNRLITRDNIIDVLNELGYQPGGGEGGFELNGVFNWYLRTGQGVGVQAPDLDLVGTEGYPWTANYQPPTANPDEKYVWKFTDFRYKDGSTPENPILHITVGPELITTFTSGGGMGVEFAYALFDKEVTEVILSEDDGELPVSEAPNAVPQEGGEWTKSLDSLSYDADSYLWMSQRKISADGIPALWEKPIRLSGADGDPGADAFDTEFIYHRSGRKPTTEDDNLLHVDNIRSQDDYVPNNSNWMWTDNPQGVDNDIPEHKYEWMAFRIKMDPTHPDYDSSHPEWKWSHWSTIRIWAAYGERGMDGDGIEYVYRREWSGSPEDVNHSNEDFIPTTNNPTPSAPSGPVFIYGEDSSGQGGIEQSWNGKVYSIGDPTNPNNWRPEGWDGGFNRWKADVGTYNRQGEWIPANWGDEPKGVDENHKKEYVSQRKRVNEVWGSFSPPTVWATFSKEHTIDFEQDENGVWWWVIDGERTDKKVEGENGKGIDLKGKVDYYDEDHRDQLLEDGFEEDPNHTYTFLSDVENTYHPEVGDCYVVMLNGHIYLYVGGDEPDWKSHWSDFGEFQGEGAYVHIAWSTRVWTDNNGILHADNFTVDRPGNSTVEYAWMGICTNNDENDPGESNLTKYKWNYVHGRDGDTYERVYIRTERNVTPIIKKTQEDEYPTYNDFEGPHPYSKDEYLPFVDNYEDIVDPNDPETVITPGCYPEDSGNSGNHVYQFSDDPKGVNSVYRYEWRAERKKVDGVWQNFGRVILESNYSNNGQGVIRSTVFKRSVTQPIIPSGGDFTSPRPSDSDWRDGLPTGTVGSIWMSSAIFTSDGLLPQSGWSVPILLQDSDTLDIELSTNSRNNPPAAPVKYEEATVQNPCNSHVPEEGEDGYDPNKPSEAIGDQIWYDPEKDADYINSNASNFNWMATRTNYINPSTGNHDWRDWIIILIKGEAGEAGKEFQHAYLAYPTALGQPRLVSTSTSYNAPPTTSATQGYNEGNAWLWTLNTTANITVGPEDSLWMTERWLQPGTNEVGTWDNPIRISGTGTPGEDAEDIQFIYKQSTDLPNDPTNTDIPSIPKAVKENVDPVFWEGNVELVEGEWVPIDWNTTVNGEWSSWQWDSSVGEYNEEGEWIPVGWTDSPTGVDEINKYEWMCQRIKPRTNDPNHTDWGPWSKVFVWSAYGDTGMDGDGVEYIFYREKEIEPKTPVGPYYKSSASSSAVKWTGGIVDISTTSTPDWRPKGIDTFYSWEYGSYNEQGEWIPTHWINNNSIVPVLSNEGDPIWTDEPLGVGEEYTIANPEFDSNQDEDPINNPRTLTKTYIHEWVSQRKRVNGSWGDFSEPTLWTNFSHTPEIYIDNGQWIVDGVPVGNAEGPAGQGIQLKGVVDVIYQKYATDGKTSLQWVNPWLPDENTSPYSDIEPGDCFVVRQTGHLYLCLHSKNNWNKTNQDVITDESWPYVSPMTNDPNWEDIGEFQGQGSYMHIAWAASDDKHFYGTSNIIFNQEDGKISLIKHFLTDYTLKLSDVDYDWMGVCTNNEIDDPPCNYNPDTYDEVNKIGTNWKLYKWNNVRGRDGDNYERVYIKTRTAVAPEIDCTVSEGVVTYPNWTYPDPNNPSQTITHTYQDAEYLPAVKDYNPELTGTNQPYSNDRFTDDPTGVSSEFPYEWMAERKKKLNTSTNMMEWRPFSLPALWAKYSFDGIPGLNASGIQTRYITAPSSVSSISIINLTEDPPRSTIDGQTRYWQSNTSELTINSSNFLWMTQREYTPEETTHNNWSTPVRLSGADGDPGADGTDIEFIYKRSNRLPVNPSSGETINPLVHDIPTMNQNSPDFIPNYDEHSSDFNDSYETQNNSGWTDNPQGVDLEHKYEWACQRIKPSGTNTAWGDWSNVYVWSAYGDTGMDGDGIEYVYYRWDSIEPLVTPSEPKLKRIAPGQTAESIISWNKRVEKVPGTSNPVQWQPKTEDWDESVYGTFNSWDSNSGKFNDQGEWIPVAKKRSGGQDVIITTGEHPNEIETYWTDDPQGVGKETIGSTTIYYICEWVSVRKRINGEDWSTFSPPKLWASFGSDVKIIGGDWYINGVYCGKAEGEDGKGVALKGTVDVLNRSDRQDYASANGIEDYTTVKALQDIQPINSLGVSSINIGDCYVVKQNRYLYTSKSWFNSTDTPDDRYWNSTNQTISNWWGTTENPGPGQDNWAEIGEFQGADGESSYMHIVWATDEAVKRADDGTILLVNPFIPQYEQLDRDTSYEWMGVCTSDEELDPPNDYDSKYDSSLEHDNGAYGEYESYEEYVKDHPLDYNWHLYKWNHVKGKDGSDYEKVFIKTKTNTGTGPGVNQNAYQGTGGHDDPTKDEFYPQVLNYDNNPSNYSNPTFTDDPTGPTATYPYEWVAERRKKLNPTTQSMEWGPFNSPATLWAMYAFDGMTAYLTKSSDNIVVDSLGTIVGGLGSSPNYRLYTEVKIWDPNKDNGTGGYLAYQSTSGDVQPGKYKLSISNKTPSHITTSIVSSSGRINITDIGTATQIINTNQYSFTITATVFGGKTFSFVYTITVTHLEQTYFTYSLSNDYDSITYRTKTKQYDGLPVETILRAQINGKTIGNASEISLDRGYMKSVTVTSSSFYITGTGGTTETFTKTVNSNIVDNTFDSYGSEENIIIKNSSGTDTGLRLNIFSDGTVRLSRQSSDTDVDLPDAKHYLDISCVVVYMGVEYPSIVKRFTISEITDSTLYDLILSKTNVIERLGVYSPSNITAKVKVTDENGENTYTPNSSSGRVGTVGSIYVKFFKNNAANLPTTYSSTNTNFFYPCNNITSSLIQNNTITAVVIDTQSSVYHDIQEITISHEVPESSVDITPSQFIVDCNSSGKVSSTRYLDFTAWLKWGGVTCTKSQLVEGSCSIAQTMGGTYTSPSSLTIADDGTVSGRYTFTANQPLTSGEITITLTGSIGGDTTVAYGTISVIAQKQGQPGDFKSTAFIKTYTDISTWLPTGGTYSSPFPTDFEGKTRPTGGWGWEDGIPAGEETLWSSTATFYGSGAAHTWSFPKIVRDSETYDVEFALKQANGNVPNLPVKYDEATTTNKCNAHRPTSPNTSICDPQIWYDPEEDSETIQSNYDKFYWKAEREIINGATKPWVITQIKGESEPNIRCDTPIIVIETDPTGKLNSSSASAAAVTIKTWLRLGETVQSPLIGSCVGSLSSNGSVTVNNSGVIDVSDNYSLSWTITPVANTVLSNTDLTITMANASCSASKTISIVFEGRNRSQFKSFVFKRFASTPSASDAPSTTATGGSYENNGLPTGTTGRDSGWSDGLPTDGGTDPIYMSSRTFYSDGQPDNDSWSTPVRMSDTDVFDVEFSFEPLNPGQPGDTGKDWYDPSGNPPSGYTWADAIWMATNTKDSSGSWSGWVVVRIKGETGNTGTGISSITSWYKAFDTLDVVIPNAGNETDGWTEDDDLTGAGWTNSYIKPTKENPYLWKFIRTEYENPPSVVHSGLEMIQVWSENMINPNLLDDTDFIDDNHMNAWKSGSQATVSYNWGDCVCEHVFNTNNEYSSSLPSPYQNQRLYGGYCKEASSSYSDGGLVVLKQNIYVKEDKISKISPGQWYTLSFWLRGSSTYSNTSLNFQIESKYSSGSTETTLIDTNAGIYTNDVRGTSKNIGFSYNSTNNELVPNTSSTHAFKNVWKKFIITFKIKDTISENFTSAHFEWTLNPSTEYRMGFWISMPKLEIGKVATDYISSSTIRDPYPRLTVWAPGKQYYQGKYGEPYLDAVTYGANWFRCRNTHLSSESNKPFSGQTTLYWEPAQNLDFIVTDLLLAETGFIKNLVVGGLRTGDMGTPHVEMKGSSINFYGRKEFANIRMSVDSEGMAFLSFYDNMNNFLYDLGPSGLRWKVIVTNASFTTRELVEMSGGELDFQSTNTPVTTLHKFIPKKEDGIIVGDTNYTNGDRTIAESANGKYFTSRNFLMDDGEGGKKIDLSKLASGTFREKNETVETIPSNNIRTNQDKEQFLNDIVTFYNFPLNNVNEIDLTLNDNGVGLKTPIMLQHGMVFNSGSDRAIVGFKQGNETWSNTL